MPRYLASSVYPGANRLVNAFAGAGDSRRKAFSDEMKSLANADYLRARMGESDAKTAATEQRTAYLGAENAPGYVAEAAGAPLPLVQKVREYMGRGNWGERAPQVDPQELEQQADLGSPAAPAIPVTETPEDVKPFLAKILNAVAQRGTVLSATHSDPNQIAQAGQRIRDTSLEDQALGGQITPEELGAVKAAIAGKPLYSDAQGRVLDRFRGALNEGGDQAQANVDLTGARTEQATSAAERNTAQAAAASALAAQRRNPIASGKTPAEVATVKWYADNMFGGDVQKAADWVKRSKSKSPEQLYIETRVKLANGNPILAMNPAKLDKATQDAVQAAVNFGRDRSAPAKKAPGAQGADAITARFGTDPAVKSKGYKLGDQMEDGTYEVLDDTGNVVGYYE